MVSKEELSKLTYIVFKSGKRTDNYKNLKVLVNSSGGIKLGFKKLDGYKCIGMVKDFPLLVNCFNNKFNVHKDLNKLLKQVNEMLEALSLKENGNVGYYEKGKVKIRENQHKRHYTQMSIEERRYLGKCLNRVKKFDRSFHLRSRIEEGKVFFPKELIKDSFADRNIWANIIEYNETLDKYKNRYNQRVLFMCNDVVEANIRGKREICNLFIVYDFTTNEVITAYLNSVEDEHANLDRKRYTLNSINKIKSGGLVA